VYLKANLPCEFRTFTHESRVGSKNGFSRLENIDTHRYINTYDWVFGPQMRVRLLMCKI